MRLFVYFSELLKRRVVDADGKDLGKVYDVTMRMNEEVFPRAENVVVRKGMFNRKYASIAITKASQLGRTFRLSALEKDVHYQSKKIRGAFSLRRDILDQQVVDTHGQKVVRVNDVHLLRVDNQLYLAHVDVGLRGLVRRLEWGEKIDLIVKFFNPKATYLSQEEFISWRNSQVLSIGRRSNVLRSDVARRKIAKIPPTELAQIMEDLDVFEKVSLFKSFNTDLQRKVFTDMAPQEKEDLIDQLDDREAGILLENIPADEATDLLHKLPKDKTKQLMHFMHSKTSKELRKLLGFAQDSAGGLMTTEYLAVKKDTLVKDAMQKIKDNVDYPGNIFFIYILDDDNRLIETTSLRSFINEDPDKLLVDVCLPTKVFVRTDDGVEEVALLLEKYKYSSIPVLDENDVMQGVITSDDVMEVLISLAWRKYKDQI